MPKTLLLADDSPTIQRVVSLTFAGQDVDVVPVSDGDEAVEALQKTRPDVVIADVAMPGRSGYDVADYMRRSADFADVPVLLLASAFDPVDPARAQAVGARGVLTKPFAPAVIVGRVRELLHAGPITAPGPAADLIATSVLSGPSATPSLAPSNDDLALQPPTSREQSDLDAYFEQIDRAFAELKAARRPSEPVPLEDGRPGGASVEPEESEKPPEAAELPDLPPLRVNPAPVSLPDAFSALLAAESGEPVDETVPAPQPVVAPAIDMDALVDRVVARVLETMSDRLVRETVAEIVSSTAERLVQDEIERIKREID